MDNKRKCIKGFDSNLQCRGFQYEDGKTYTIPEDELSICNNGFHAIDEDECPFSVFGFYPPADDGVPNRYCEVEIGGATEKFKQTICGSEIKIGTEIGPLDIVNAHTEWVKKHIQKVGKEHETEDYSYASNTGDRSSASNTGIRSSASNIGKQSTSSNTGSQSASSNTGSRSTSSNTGFQSSATNTGIRSSATNTGVYSSASNTGYFSSASNTGDQSSASNTGAYSSASTTGTQSSASNTGNQSSASTTGTQSSASNTGDNSSASTTGDQSSAEVSGRESVAAVFGVDSRARGALGCWLVLTERGKWDEITQLYPIIGMKAVKVDGQEIKPDTWYELKGGQVVEVE